MQRLKKIINVKVIESSIHCLPKDKNIQLGIFKGEMKNKIKRDTRGLGDWRKEN
jgi:hypothetical protein